MTAESNLVEKCVDIVKKNGNEALEKAKAEMTSPKNSGTVSAGLKHFAKVTLRDALPVFPALVSLSCKATGGKPEKTIGVSAALSLIASAADVHDDIMDKSAEKHNKKTVYGKFGADIALLVGDALLFQGLNLLHRESAAFSEEQKLRILSLVNEAFLKSSKAEAKETAIKGKIEIQPEKYFEILQLKCAVPQVHCQIGAVIAGASDNVVSKMGEFGKTYGIVALIAEEFVDLLTLDELENRLKNECPPLPFLHALQNPMLRHELLQLTSDATMSAVNFKRVVAIVMKSKDAQDICKRMDVDFQIENSRLSFIKGKDRDELLSLLSVPKFSLQQLLNQTVYVVPIFWPHTYEVKPLLLVLKNICF